MTLPNPLPQPDASWEVDERSLTLFVEKLKEPPADRAWYELRREAERIALVPGFDPPTDPDDWHRVTKAIISHDRARTRRHAEEILRHRWDLVIVDEAHKVKSHRGATYQFIERIERDFILLLTATPLQNDLRELYNLVTLLRPGQLGTWQEFKSEHLVSGDHRQPRDPEALRALTHEVIDRKS